MSHLCPQTLGVPHHPHLYHHKPTAPPQRQNNNSLQLPINQLNLFGETFRRQVYKGKKDPLTIQEFILVTKAHAVSIDHQNFHIKSTDWYCVGYKSCAFEKFEHTLVELKIKTQSWKIRIHC
ncbi:hypothetical protein VP01_1525g5 [Puccinia sorghi]|uniref:Uncharacterized protein n=1 Tax=Puccinia sorghi TaxID=27349 RepID=A0A0L6VIV7_9BASI|nr:hypothetical protein VP01_1525g5 [Puccinia sorghi]